MVQFYSFNEEVKLFIALYPCFEGQFKVNIITIRGSNFSVYMDGQRFNFSVLSSLWLLCLFFNTKLTYTDLHWPLQRILLFLLFIHVINTLIHPFRQQQKLKFIYIISFLTIHVLLVKKSVYLWWTQYRSRSNVFWLPCMFRIYKYELSSAYSVSAININIKLWKDTSQ